VSKARAIIALLAALTLAPAALHAGTSAAALYNQGNALYQQGRFAEAREAYGKALEAGAGNADLYFNLGNAELKSGELGRAVGDYLRAQRLEPRDPDLRFNLAYARAMITARLPELPQGPFTRAFNAAVEYLSASEWTAAALAAYWALALAAIAMIVARGRAREASRLALYIAAAALVITLPFAATRIKRDVFTPRGVIVAEKVTAHSGPGDENAALFDLVSGIDVTVAQCDRGWCNVSAPGGFSGWVEAKSFERL